MSSSNLPFSIFSDGSNYYEVDDEVARGQIVDHGNVLMATGEGAHGIRYSNGTLSYKDPATGDWMSIKTSSVVAITQEDYDALSESEKNRDILYVITDAYLQPYDESQIIALAGNVSDILELLGDISISSIDDGTVTGAISDIDTRVSNLENSLGLSDKSTEFNADGSITETEEDVTVKTVFNTDGSITETYTYKDGSAKRKLTVFNADGTISETVQEVN